MVKKHAAKVNMELGLLDPEIARRSLPLHEVESGKFDDQFVLDVFQTGSGISTNMNAMKSSHVEPMKFSRANRTANRPFIQRSREQRPVKQ